MTSNILRAGVKRWEWGFREDRGVKYLQGTPLFKKSNKTTSMLAGNVHLLYLYLIRKRLETQSHLLVAQCSLQHQSQSLSFCSLLPADSSWNPATIGLEYENQGHVNYLCNYSPSCCRSAAQLVNRRLALYPSLYFSTLMKTTTYSTGPMWFSDFPRKVRLCFPSLLLDPKKRLWPKPSQVECVSASRKRLLVGRNIIVLSSDF